MAICCPFTVNTTFVRFPVNCQVPFHEFAPVFVQLSPNSHCQKALAKVPVKVKPELSTTVNDEPVVANVDIWLITPLPRGTIVPAFDPPAGFKDPVVKFNIPRFVPVVSNPANAPVKPEIWVRVELFRLNEPEVRPVPLNIPSLLLKVTLSTC